MAERMAELILVLIAVAVVNEVSVCHGARDGLGRRKQASALRGDLQKNICDVSDRDSAVHCYCEPSRELKSASRAECWVFSGRVERDDPAWSSFSSQPTLLTLAFSVRVEGALPYIPTIALQPLHSLRQLSIKYGDIESVTKYALANLTNLVYLNLSQNNIQSLQPYAITHLPNLIALYLEDNLIRNIQLDSFHELPALQTLVLAKNNISFLRDGTFCHTYGLLELDLSRNKIFQLSRHMFDGLANLRRLDLRMNQIRNLTEFTFAELWNLSELLLSKNLLKYVSERAFDGLSLLRELILDNNRLFALPTKLFEGVRGLKSVDLRFNHLRDLTNDNIRPIWDNLEAADSKLLIDGNNLTCSCGLIWMKLLYNASSSIKTRSSFSNATCVLQEPEDTETITIENSKVVSKGIIKNILDTPSEMLPCPKPTATITPFSSTRPVQVQVSPGTKSYRLYDLNSAHSEVAHLFSIWVYCLILLFWYFN